MTLWARRYRVTRAALLAAVQVAIWRVLADPIHIPGRGSEIEWVLSPLVPSLLAMATPDALQVAHEDSEIVSRQPVARRRVLVTGVLLVVAVAAAVAGESAGADRLVAIRNSVQLLGVALWAALLLPRAIAWGPAMVVPVVMWLIGTPEPGDRTPDWALLLHDQRSLLAAAVAVLTAVSGALGYVCRTWPFGRR